MNMRMQIRSLIALVATTLFGVFFLAAGAQATTRSIEVTVTDQNDDPAVGVWVSGWSDDYTILNGWAYETTDENGQAGWEVDDADTGSWNVSIWGDGYSSGYNTEPIVPTEGVTEVAITVQKTDAVIRINLEDSDGAAFTIPETSWGSVSCYTENWTNYFWGSFDMGASTTDVSVVADTYTCEAWIDGYGASGASVTVASDATEELVITLLERDATLNVALVDENGDPITGVESFSAYAYSVADPSGTEYYNDFAWGSGSSGTAELQVLSGGYTYQVGVWVDATSESGGGGEGEFGGDDGFGDDEGSGDEYDYKSGGMYTAGDGARYIQNYTMEEVSSPERDGETTVPFTLEEADGTIEVTVLGVDGEPDAYSWVHGMNAGSSDWTGFVGGSADENGKATLYVKSGVTYEVSAYPTGAWDGTVLPPASQRVKLEKDGTKSLTMQAVEADHTINLTASFGSESLSATAFGADFVFCFVYDPATGRSNWGEISDGSGTIAWLSNSSAYVGCDGYTDETYYRAADVKVKTGAKDGSTDVTVNLSDAGSWYEETSYSFDNSSGATTLELPDGESELVIPKEALASDTVTLTVGSASGLPSNDSDYNAGVNWEFSARDSSGNDLTEFNQDLTLHLKYDEDRLEDLGLTEDGLAAASFDEDTNSYTSTSSTTVDTDKDVVTSSIAHFSSYALLGDRGLGSDEVDKPSEPKQKKLVVKKRKAKRANLTWQEVDGADDYTVQMRKCKNDEKSQCKKAKHFQKQANYRKFSELTGTKKTVKQLKTGTYYQWRVKACNDGGCSEFTDWTRFKTKE